MVPDSMDHDYDIKHRMEIGSKFESSTRTTNASNGTAVGNKKNSSDTLLSPRELENNDSNFAHASIV